MPLQATSGAASYDAFGGGVAAVPNYIEDIFGTFLYTGNGSTQTITNGIDLAGEGGLVWLKSRSGADSHELTNTIQGISNSLRSNSTNGASATDLTGFTSSGFTLGNITGNTNSSGATEVSWTFRKQPKFFDVVTYTGTGSARTVAHNLGSVPGCIIVKKTNAGGTNWTVYHRSIGNTKALRLNTTEAETSSAVFWNNTSPTSTDFTVNTNSGVNESGETYVAYLFAHDSGGFGLTGTDNVISCGSVAATGGVNNVVNLGYEPQLVIIKSTTVANDWHIIDNMRGFTANNGVAHLFPNTSSSEYQTTVKDVGLTSTGFTIDPDLNGFNGTATYIYIAIRRGPMKVPTDGTKVFRPYIIPINSASATTPINAGLTTDAVFGAHNSDESGGKYFASRLTANYRLDSTSTAAEALGEYYWDNMVGVRQQETNAQPTWYFCKRAPSFFDEVCYTGTGSTTAYSHNLGVAPELMIVKSRNDVNDWAVYSSALGNTKYLFLNTTAASATTYPLWASTTPSATTFTTNGTYNSVGGGGVTYTAYLFASCPGVSKVFSFTGNGSTQTIDCGFTGGARFVLLKASSATGGWYVYDTARGMTVLTDPYLQLNSTAAETATLGSVTTVSTGFAVNEAITTGVNTNGVTYIGLAIS